MLGRYANVKDLGNGQINQDIFVLTCLNNKQNGSFLEIGSEHPIIINNTYFLETKLQSKKMMDYRDGMTVQQEKAMPMIGIIKIQKHENAIYIAFFNYILSLLFLYFLPTPWL